MRCSKFMMIISIDEDDFSTTVQTVTFPADEGATFISEIGAFIPIVDDDIDESIEQIFIAHLEVIEATNFALLNNTICSTALCRIMDNDGEEI